MFTFNVFSAFSTILNGFITELVVVQLDCLHLMLPIEFEELTKRFVSICLLWCLFIYLFINNFFVFLSFLFSFKFKL